MSGYERWHSGQEPCFLCPFGFHIPCFTWFLIANGLHGVCTSCTSLGQLRLGYVSLRKAERRTLAWLWLTCSMKIGLRKFPRRHIKYERERRQVHEHSNKILLWCCIQDIYTEYITIRIAYFLGHELLEYRGKPCPVRQICSRFQVGCPTLLNPRPMTHKKHYVCTWP